MSCQNAPTVLADLANLDMSSTCFRDLYASTVFSKGFKNLPVPFPTVTKKFLALFIFFNSFTAVPILPKVLTDWYKALGIFVNASKPFTAPPMIEPGIAPIPSPATAPTAPPISIPSATPSNKIPAE